MYLTILNRSKTITFLIIILLFVLKSFSQERGFPFIKNYLPNEYNVIPQFWSITQDKRGVMYFGAADALVEYDGTKWRKIKIPQNKIVRALCTDSNGVVYLGAKGEFGFLQANKNGKTVYISLSNKLDSVSRKFNNIYKINSSNDKVYFLSHQKIFIYSNKTNKIIHSINAFEKPFYDIFKINNNIFVYQKNYGLSKISNNKLIKIKNTEKLIIKFIVPYKTDKYLLATSKGIKTYYIENNTLIEFNDFEKEQINKTNSFFKNLKIHYSVLLKNGNYAIATLRNGIVLMNNKSEIIGKISKNTGLQNQTVYFLYQDNQALLWAALENGISKLETDSPYRIFNKNNNIEGVIYNTIRYKGTIYITTNLGVFYLYNNNFVPIKGITGNNAKQCLGVKKFKINNKTKLIVTTNNGIYEIDSTDVKKISNFVSYQINQSVNDSSIFYADSFSDIIILKYKNHRWTSDTLNSLDSYLHNIQDDKENNIWGIIDEKPFKINNSKEFINYSKSNNLKEIIFNDIVNHKNKLIFLTNKGIYRYKPDKDVFYEDTLFNKHLHKKNRNILNLKIISDNLYRILLKNEGKKIVYDIKKVANNYFIDSISYKRFYVDENIYSDGDTLLWLMESDNLYKFDLKYKKKYVENKYVLIRKVITGSDSILFSGTYFREVNGIKYTDTIQADFLKPKLKIENNNITFEFSLPSYTGEYSHLYSWILIGTKQNKWSKWTKNNRKEFMNLSHGKYKFIVKAKNIYGIESKHASFEFTILPPWYRTIYAYTLYMFLAILFVLTIIKLYTNKLKKEKNHLQKKVENRTLEIMKQKEEMLLQTKNLKKVNSIISRKNIELRSQKEEMEAITNNLKDANKKIKIKNKFFTSGINYAQRIQLAILPENEYIKKYIPNYFIFYKPRDIVSGDFYWFKKTDNQLIIIVADCTGHGVPGAFMSMLGIAFLNEIINSNKIIQTNQVLDKLREKVKSTLHQSDIIKSSNDGIDMAICAIKLSDFTLQYSGANNPIYLIRNNKLIELKPDRMPIGINPREKPFSSKDMKLIKGDKLYLLTDGFADQIGGAKRQKYLSMNLKNLILEISNQDSDKQHTILKDTFEKWKSNVFYQMDDVLIWGIDISSIMNYELGITNYEKYQ